MSWLATEKAAIKSFTGLALGYPIIQENDTKERQKEAEGSDFWFEVFNLPASNEPLSKNTTDQYNSIFQINIYGQLNKGKAGVLALGDTVLAAYKTGQQYSDSGCTIEIDSSVPSPASPNGGFYLYPLSITWFAYIDR